MHRIRSYIRRHWRGLLNILTAVAMVVVIYALRDEIIATLENIQRVNYFALFLMLPLQVLNYDAYARLYRVILRHLKQPVRYSSLYRVALELNFVNHAFPSGGISGISYFGLRLRAYGVSGASATLVQLFKFIFVFISFQVLIGVALLALAIGGRANNVMLLLAAVLATLTAVGTFLMFYIIGSERRINNTFTVLTKGLNKVISWVRPAHPETISIAKVRTMMSEMHRAFEALKGNYKVLRRGLLFALIANITEILTLYVVYIAFGEFVNIGAVIIAYAIANFAGLISVLPGGIGVFETLMTAALAAGGIPAALSIPVVVMYRVLNMAIQLGPGWVLYHDSLRKGQTA